MRLVLNPNSIEDYRLFLRVKSLPIYNFRGREAWFPDEYADRLGLKVEQPEEIEYRPSEFLFDYQRDVSAIALRKKKYAAFIAPGLGKTLIYLEYARTILPRLIAKDQGILLTAPSMVIDQTIDEAHRFYGSSLPIESVKSGNLSHWLQSCAGKIGVTNYEAFRNPIDRGQLGALIADESHTLASHYGKYSQGVVALGRGLEWKLSGTGMPAPNDRIEYANQAVFLDHFPTINSFLARYFVNRGQTSERWMLKKYALEEFYRSLSHWCIFLSNPAVYGWKDNCDSIPPIRVHVHDVEMTGEQHAAVRKQTGALFAHRAGGITSRSKLSKIAKGIDGTATLKYDFIKNNLVDTWPDKSTIIWAWFNDEQDRLEKMFPDAASIQGKTKPAKRAELLADFQSGRRKILISKADILGYGMNLQIATKHVFSSLIDSFRDFWQCVKRSNRVGSTEELDVHIPMLDIERPMVETVLTKAKRIEEDARQQEAIFLAARAGRSIEELAAREGIDLEKLLDDQE